MLITRDLLDHLHPHRVIQVAWLRRATKSLVPIAPTVADVWLAIQQLRFAHAQAARRAYLRALSRELDGDLQRRRRSRNAINMANARQRRDPLRLTHAQRHQINLEHARTCRVQSLSRCRGCRRAWNTRRRLAPAS